MTGIISRVSLRRVVVVLLSALGLLLPSEGSASASLPDTSDPSLSLNRTIPTTPFAGSSISTKDNEGSTYVSEDNSLWLADDNGNAVYEVDATTGALKQKIARAAFNSAQKFGGGPAAGEARTDDFESFAYDRTNERLYLFSGACCTPDILPTAFRLTRNNGVFQVDSYQPLASDADYTASAWNSADGMIYVGVGHQLRTYDYETNIAGPTFQVPNLSGIFGLGFSSDGADLFVVTSAETLKRVDWASKTVLPSWTFDLTPFGVLDSRAVELIGDQLFVSDGSDSRPPGPLKYAVFVFDVLGPAPATAPNDFNGDGRSDILWRNSSSGEDYLWFMNGTQIGSHGGTLTLSDTAWKVAGTGDFNGDAKADIVWRNSSTGEVYVWLMNGATLSSHGSVFTLSDQNWKLVGTGDFNGDAKSDLLWRNAVTGENYLWFMNGTALSSASGLLTLSDLNWKVSGTGDFNGDTKSDIVWRNTSNGQVYVWLMNGATITSSGAVFTLADPNWKVAGTGDYDGDGKSDLLWRNDVTGENYLWFMNGTALSSSGGLLTLNLAWKVAGTGDYDGNAKADIVWRNSSTGEVYVWLMNGTTIASHGSTFTLADPNWEIVPSNPPAGQAFATSSSDMTFTVSTKAKPKLTAAHNHLWWHKAKGGGPRTRPPTQGEMTWTVKTR